MLAGIAVPVPPDPERVAAALVRAGHRHVALLHAAGDAAGPHGRFSFVAADPIDRCNALDPHDPLGEGAAESAASGDLARAPRWIGVVPYESRRQLERDGWRPTDTRPPALLDRPEWYRYPAVATFDHRAGSVLVVADDRRAARHLADLVRSATTPPGAGPIPGADLSLEVTDDEDPSRHAERVAAARELILAGDLYQVNLARRLRVAITKGRPFDLYRRLAATARAPFSAYLELEGDARVLATSPELLLSAEPAPRAPSERPAPPSPGGAARFGRLTTEPIKGTRPRGAHAADDASHARDLDADPKERAELSMIVDVERNDLGRVARIGSVRVTAPPHVVTHRTIHHRVARLTALADPSFSRDDVLRAMLPSGSVTGAPKVRAMEVIATLEPRRRGLYTGGFGFVRHDGALELAMAIRTLVLRGAEGEYWTGGGIVADSDPLREVEETRWKALQLMRAATR